jgi:O-antigen ligase
MIRWEYERFRVKGAIRPGTGHLHSNPIHLAAERGLPALAAWIWIWLAFFCQGVKRLRLQLSKEGWTARAEMGSAGMAAVAAFLTAGLFEYNFGDSEVVMMVYWLMAFPLITGCDVRRS